MKRIILITICILLQNCASFNKIKPEDNYIRIDKNNFPLLSGKYKIYSTNNLTKNNKVNDSIKVNLYHKLNLKTIDTSYNFKNSNTIDISFLKNNFIKISLIEKEKIINSFKTKYRIKNGMCELKNSNSQTHNIPFLFGGIANSKVRIGIHKNKNLIVNNAYEGSGAILFIFWAGNSHNTYFQFEKLTK